MSPIIFLLALTAGIATAQPLRPELSGEEVYPGYLHEASYDDKQLRNLDSIGGGNLLRDLENGLIRSRAYLHPRSDSKFDTLSGIAFGTSKRFDQLAGRGFGSEKRNGMDEIDRSGFNTFIKKKNFDEIDRSGFDGFVKRNFDEIDRVGFNGFVKRGGVNN